MSVRLRHVDDRGSMIIIFALLSIPLAILTAGALYCGFAYARWSMLSSALAAARESTMTSGFHMMLKNSADPGALIAEKLACELRESNVDCDLAVWFVESQDSSLGDDRRALAYCAILTETYGEGFFVGALEIPCSTSASIVPYATERVFKPTSADTVYCYHFPSRSRTCSVSTSPLTSTTPLPLVQALQEAESRAKKR